MNLKIKLLSLGFLIILSIGSSSSHAGDREWDEVVKKARGQVVDWYMQEGIPSAVAFARNHIAPGVKALYGIELRIVPVENIHDIAWEIYRATGSGHKNNNGKVDLVWFGERTLAHARKKGYLFGPFSGKLPNQKLVDWTGARVKNDLCEPLDGMVSPWGRYQMVLLHDNARIKTPPRTMGELITWIHRNPGRFAFPSPLSPTGSAFIAQLFYHVSDEIGFWQKSEEETRFDTRRSLSECFSILKELLPDLLEGGKRFPSSREELNRLFAENAVDFSISFNPAEASNRIRRGLFPDTVRSFLLEEGTVSGTHYVAIPFNAAEKEGAMVTANFLLSVEAQYWKADPAVWGDYPVISLDRLSHGWQEKFGSLKRELPEELLASRRLPELSCEYRQRFHRWWRKLMEKGSAEGPNFGENIYFENLQ